MYILCISIEVSIIRLSISGFSQVKLYDTAAEAEYTTVSFRSDFFCPLQSLNYSNSLSNAEIAISNCAAASNPGTSTPHPTLFSSLVY